jgi:hypothetical protein
VSPEEVEEGWKHVHEVSAVACMHGDNCSVGDACQVGGSTAKMRDPICPDCLPMAAWKSMLIGKLLCGPQNPGP